MVLIYISVRQTLYFILPSTIIPLKKYVPFYQKPLWVYGLTSRSSKENKRKEEIYLSRTVLLLTFTFSLISELSLGFAAMPVCYGFNSLFCLLWLVLFLMLSSSCILFIIILICMHARFFKRKISHSSIHPFIRRLITIPHIYLSI